MSSKITSSKFQSVSLLTKQTVKQNKKAEIQLTYPKDVYFGFESTWRMKNAEKQKAHDENDNDEYIDTNLLTNNPRFNEEFKKLTVWEEVANDPFNIEIPTKKINDKAKLLKEFGLLSKLLAKHDFIESSKSVNNHYEGGGHIHIDYTEIFGDLGYGNDFHYIDFLCKQAGYGDYSSYGFKRSFANLNYSKFNDSQKAINKVFALFTHNMFTFMQNNPWIPWTLNDPNDNENAMVYAKPNLAKNIRVIEKIGLQLTRPFTIDVKTYAVTFRPDLGTFEFRFFSMPKNSRELDYHLELVKAIHKHCFDLTVRGIKLKAIYSTDKKKGKLLTTVTYRESINGLKKVCKLLNVSFDKLDKMNKLNNLKIRYAYHQAYLEEVKPAPTSVVLN